MALMAKGTALKATGLEAVHCFFCGKPIEEDMSVVWIGKALDGSKIKPTIMLHGGCTMEMMIRLAIDVRAFEQAQGANVTEQKVTLDFGGLMPPPPMETGDGEGK